MNKLGWIVGAILSIMGSLVGAFSKLLIRKSWKLLPPAGTSIESASDKALLKKSKTLHFIGMVGMGLINPACEYSPRRC